MIQVTDQLYLSGIEAAGDRETLDTNGVTAVVKLTHGAPDGSYPKTVTVVSNPILDGPQCEFGSFYDAVDHTERLLEAGETVLVHCAAGSSRSVAVVAATLTRTEAIDLTAAFKRIQDRKPTVDPHPALVRYAHRAGA